MGCNSIFFCLKESQRHDPGIQIFPSGSAGCASRTPAPTLGQDPAAKGIHIRLSPSLILMHPETRGAFSCLEKTGQDLLNFPGLEADWNKPTTKPP